MTDEQEQHMKADLFPLNFSHGQQKERGAVNVREDEHCYFSLYDGMVKHWTWPLIHNTKRRWKQKRLMIIPALPCFSLT